MAEEKRFHPSQLSKKGRKTYARLVHAVKTMKIRESTLRAWRDAQKLQKLPVEKRAGKIVDEYIEVNNNDDLNPFHYCYNSRQMAIRQALGRGQAPIDFCDPLLIAKKKRDEWLNSTTPYTDKYTDFIGVEIECYVENADVVSLQEDMLKNGVTRAEITTDGSLRTPMYRDTDKSLKNIEIRILSRIGSGMENIKKLGEWLKMRKGRVNSKCGLHVHLDMRYADKLSDGTVNGQIARADEMARVDSRLVRALPLLLAMQHPSRRTNRFAVPSSNLNGSDNPASARYHAINWESMRSHRTVEIRLHSGTTDADKIMHWARLLHELKTTDYTGEIKTPADAALLLPNLPENTLKYIAARFDLFSGSPAEIAKKNKAGVPYVDEDAEEVRLADNYNGHLFTEIMNRLEKANTFEEVFPLDLLLQTKKRDLEAALGTKFMLYLTDMVTDAVKIARTRAYNYMTKRDLFHLQNYRDKLAKLKEAGDLHGLLNLEDEIMKGAQYESSSAAYIRDSNRATLLNELYVIKSELQNKIGSFKTFESFDELLTA